MPTSSTDRRALPSVRKAGNRPANSDMASPDINAVSARQPVKDNLTRTRQEPSPNKTQTCRQPPACAAASSKSGPGPYQVLTSCSSRVRTAAAIPAPAPVVSNTANQKPAAPGRVSVAGIEPAAFLLRIQLLHPF